MVVDSTVEGTLCRADVDLTALILPEPSIHRVTSGGAGFSLNEEDCKPGNVAPERPPTVTACCARSRLLCVGSSARHHTATRRQLAGARYRSDLLDPVAAQACVNPTVLEIGATG
jgi:hypothetical protein